MVLPFQPVTLTFRDIHYYVDLPRVQQICSCQGIAPQNVLRCAPRPDTKQHDQLASLQQQLFSKFLYISRAEFFISLPCPSNCSTGNIAREHRSWGLRWNCLLWNRARRWI